MYDVDCTVAVLPSWIKDTKHMRSNVSFQDFMGWDSLQGMVEEDNIKTNLNSKVEFCGLTSYGEDTSRCRALVNMLINIIISWNLGKLLTERTSADQGWLPHEDSLLYSRVVCIWGLHSNYISNFKGRFQVLTATSIKMAVCWDVAPFTPVVL
jgi:hypothetical protein